MKMKKMMIMILLCIVLMLLMTATPCSDVATKPCKLVATRNSCGSRSQSMQDKQQLS